MRERQRVAAVARAAHGHHAAGREQGHGAGQPEREREHAARLRQLGQVRDVLHLHRVVVQSAGQVRHGARRSVLAARARVVGGDGEWRCRVAGVAGRFPGLGDRVRAVAEPLERDQAPLPRVVPVVDRPVMV